MYYSKLMDLLLKGDAITADLFFKSSNPIFYIIQNLPPNFAGAFKEHISRYPKVAKVALCICTYCLLIPVCLVF